MHADARQQPRRFRVAVSDEQGRRLRAGGLAEWLVRVAPVQARGLVNVAIVTDGRVRALNRRYRRRDHVTDVLSFPALPNRQSPIPNPFLGDIVIARGAARRQAVRVGHSEPTEFRVLALHGLLHLLGYDHEVDHGEMAALERRLRRKGGLLQGLSERPEPELPPRRSKL